MGYESKQPSDSEQEAKRFATSLVDKDIVMGASALMALNAHQVLPMSSIFKSVQVGENVAAPGEANHEYFLAK